LVVSSRAMPRRGEQPDDAAKDWSSFFSSCQQTLVLDQQYCIIWLHLIRVLRSDL
jgi:hypothetical protein